MVCGILFAAEKRERNAISHFLTIETTVGGIFSLPSYSYLIYIFFSLQSVTCKFSKVTFSQIQNC